VRQGDGASFLILEQKLESYNLFLFSGGNQVIKGNLGGFTYYIVMLIILVYDSEHYTRFGSQLSVVKAKAGFECLIPGGVLATCLVCL